jgi:hypothetical protein
MTNDSTVVNTTFGSRVDAAAEHSAAWRGRSEYFTVIRVSGGRGAMQAFRQTEAVSAHG